MHKQPIDLIIILCTLPNNMEHALQLIKTLLNLKLAACINLSKETHSFYHWNNKFENKIELQLLIKTKKSLQELIFNKIQSLHPYTIPELLIIPATGELNYTKWIYSQLI